MEKVNKKVHRGKILHEILKAYPGTLKAKVEAAGYKYGTFYKHKNEAELSYEIIAKYGRVINKDFSVEFPEMADIPSLIVSTISDNKKSMEQLQSEMQILLEKYSTFLEKHNSILEDNILLREENALLKKEITNLKSKIDKK